jgi:hypothetical protein
VRRIWQNSVKLVSNEIEAYTKQNSKRMIRMDSPRRGASFSCRTHVSMIHGCGTIKGLWGCCLEEGERKLDEGKRVYVQVLTTFGSWEAETSLAPWKCSIRRYPQGLSGGCFRQRAGHVLDAARDSNQWAFFSPGSGWTPCKLPIMPLVSASERERAARASRASPHGPPQERPSNRYVSFFYFFHFSYF